MSLTERLDRSLSNVARLIHATARWPELTVRMASLAKYYIDQGRSFSAQLQRQYKFQGYDWPVQSQWPPSITGDDL
jgi:hypothetical protein